MPCCEGPNQLEAGGARRKTGRSTWVFQEVDTAGILRTVPSCILSWNGTIRFVELYCSVEYSNCISRSIEMRHLVEGLEANP